MCLQGLLKDQLEIVKIKSNGKIKYAIQPLDEQLSFDKVSKWLEKLLQHFGYHRQPSSHGSSMTAKLASSASASIYYLSRASTSSYEQYSTWQAITQVLLW